MANNLSKAKISFCHCFENEGDWYVYDVNTSCTYRIDPILAHVLPLWGNLTTDEVITKLQDKFSENEVCGAIDEIIKAREENSMFLPCYPREILSPVTRFGKRIDYVGSNMILSISEQCNLRCKYCIYNDGYSYSRSHQNSYMSKETALAAIDFYVKFSPKTAKNRRIGFYGGEAMLRMDLIKDVVKYARSRPIGDTFIFFIGTNGLLLNNQEYIEFLCDNKFHINVSLDGPREIHDKFRITESNEGSYDKVMQGLEKLLKYDPSSVSRLQFKAVLCPPYDLLRVADYFENFPLFRKLGILEKPDVKISYVDKGDLDIPELVDIDDEQYNANFNKVNNYFINNCVNETRESIPQSIKNIYDNRLNIYHKRHRGPLPDSVYTAGCCSPTSGEKMHVKVDGSIVACEKMNDKAVIGNVFDGIDHKAVDKMINDFHTSVKERCKSCWALRLCKICYVSMRETYNNNDNPFVPESVCDNIRRNNEYNLKTYTTIISRNPKGLDFLND